MDGAEIFTFTKIATCRVKDNELVRNERLDADNFELLWNRTWVVSIDQFKAVFPYEHDYAEAVQNQFVSVFKWLKIVHGVKKNPFTNDSPLPSDLLINVRVLDVLWNLIKSFRFRLKNFCSK